MVWQNRDGHRRIEWKKGSGQRQNVSPRTLWRHLWRDPGSSKRKLVWIIVLEWQLKMAKRLRESGGNSDKFRADCPTQSSLKAWFHVMAGKVKIPANVHFKILPFMDQTWIFHDGRVWKNNGWRRKQLSENQSRNETSTKGSKYCMSSGARLMFSTRNCFIDICNKLSERILPLLYQNECYDQVSDLQNNTKPNQEKNQPILWRTFPNGKFLIITLCTEHCSFFFGLQDNRSTSFNRLPFLRVIQRLHE